MRACLSEQVRHILGALPSGMSFDDWYDDAMPFDAFTFLNDVQREAVTYARGYLQGAADAVDLTVLTLLQEEGVPLTFTAKRKARR